jgi:hypothetical protein
MIIAYLINDIPTLKACAATCFTWYNVAVPHIHHTLTFRERSTRASRNHLHKYFGPLASLYTLGLLPFVKQVQFGRAALTVPWVGPGIFDPQSMRHFRALVNLQDLTIADLDFFNFPMGARRYFGHFAPTLRSVALSRPEGTRQQLLDFFRLFPKLDDIKISHYHERPEAHEALDTQLVPITGGLRGRLTLKRFGDQGLLEDIIVAFGGMRFTSMDLRNVRGMQFLLEACADTLETLRIYPDDIFHRCERVLDPSFSGTSTNVASSAYPQQFDLSCSTALRSIEVSASAITTPSQVYSRTVKELLSTITSPVFSEIVVVFSERDVNFSSWRLAWVLHGMYRVREFRAAFCLETLEELRAENFHMLMSGTRAAVTEGTYHFLPCPPSVFSRTEARYDRFMASVAYSYG